MPWRILPLTNTFGRLATGLLSVAVYRVVELPMTHMRTGAVHVKVRAVGPLAPA